MAGTTWSPAPYLSKQDWLLQDGTIVSSPDFEASTSGRMVRVVGTTKSIAQSKVHTLILAAIDEMAAAQGTKRWMRIWPADDERNHRAGKVSLSGDVFNQVAELRIATGNSGNQHAVTNLLWDFESEAGLPLAATIFITMQQQYANTAIITKVVWRDTSSDQSIDSPSYYSHVDAHLQLGSLNQYEDTYRAVRKMVNDQGGILPGHVVETKNYNSQLRQAVGDFASRAKAVDDLDEIALPDLRDPNKPTLLKFKLKTTNYNASLHNEILALVQTGPLLDRLKNSYNEMISTMSQLGVVFVSKPGDNEFNRAAAGDLTALQAEVQPVGDHQLGSKDGLDHKHTVVIDFATGSVIVNCANESDRNEVAGAWDIAKFKAEVTGEQDTLMEFARAYRNPKEQARIKKILDQRATPENLK